MDWFALLAVLLSGITGGALALRATEHVRQCHHHDRETGETRIHESFRDAGMRKVLVCYSCGQVWQ